MKTCRPAKISPGAPIAWASRPVRFSASRRHRSRRQSLDARRRRPRNASVSSTARGRFVGTNSRSRPRLSLAHLERVHALALIVEIVHQIPARTTVSRQSLASSSSSSPSFRPLESSSRRRLARRVPSPPARRPRAFRRRARSRFITHIAIVHSVVERPVVVARVGRARPGVTPRPKIAPEKPLELVIRRRRGRRGCSRKARFDGR